MKVDLAYLMANYHLKKWGLKDIKVTIVPPNKMIPDTWQTKVYDLKRRYLFFEKVGGILGQALAVNGKREMRLNKAFIELNSRILVKETILHEIAHFLTLSVEDNQKHGHEWLLNCIRVGLNPTVNRKVKNR